MTLDEVEHVHFQRVNFSTSTVDMIIIFKDYKKPVVEIDAVKVTDMDKIKEWLDSIDLVLFCIDLSYIDLLRKCCLFRLEGSS